ncbi:enoyl-CoA hydratase/isomerase family protein [Marinobacter zhejiangensis]|uniref:Isohexenylglutaconyl-CoA hydratase n=1 Tax=Marinobacter zhejiangensis TaxID=488535 RepID=A0A1I4QH33_9GAMM|nr:enoyl-CoA hydratase-related protein [Marinobacter zhejiangensis]SFM38960.1 isohexenylglutaconyl-CoA hydratase [Marinobacter zhejiangensis]
MTDLPHCDTLALVRQGHALHITLNRPQARNAMSLAMVAELSAVFSRIEADDTLRAVVLRGADGHFCAGGDIKDMAGARSLPAGEGDQDPFYRLNRAFGHMIQQANESSKVVIAVLEGAVMGGGFGLACISDVAIGGPTVTFALPETSLGVIPAQIAPFVVERIGLTQTRRLALLGSKVKGNEALQLGLLHQLCGDGDELDTAIATALDRVRHCAPQATANTKRLLHRVGKEPMGALLDDAAAQFAAAVRGPEGAEGTMAFVQKRPPAWADIDTADNH